MADVAREQVLDSMKSFLRSGAYSDLTITCGSDTYNVHKVIVCGRAKFFACAENFGGQASGQFILSHKDRNNVWKESQLGVIDLPEDEPAIIKLLIQYLYEGEYEPLLPIHDHAENAENVKELGPFKDDIGNACNYDFPHSCNGQGQYCGAPLVCPHHCCYEDCDFYCLNFTCQEEICQKFSLPHLNGTSTQLLIHAKMYEIADKYSVIGLADLATEKFKLSCLHFWDHDEFAIAAHHAYSTTPDEDEGLRFIVKKTITAHLELVKKVNVKTLMAQCNGLALGILEEVIEK